MSSEITPPEKGIKKSDVFNSAALSGVLTFILLTWSRNLPADSTLSPYMTEQTISFIAGVASFGFTMLFSFIRYEVSFKVNQRDFTKKVKYLDQLIDITTCSNTRSELEDQKVELIKKAAKVIVEQKI
ncbi:hypothetical protein [Aliivibrio wodanis]|uniref:hypothetical protein n=1 Tax=Aliivibrio wodanis TaxID=80852 RepID=UPI00406C7CB0